MDEKWKTNGAGFWSTLEALIDSHKLVIDRPKGSHHPRYPEVIYPFDYGYIEGTTSSDGAGIDIWRGTIGDKSLTGIICTFDNIKSDAEIKLLIGCTEQNVNAIIRFHQDGMQALYIPKPKDDDE